MRREQEREGAGALEERRRLAAEASRGMSSDHVHQACLRLIAEKGLSGRVLDFGAGQGLLAAELHRSGRFATVTAVDLLDRPSGLDGRVGWVRQDLNHPLAIADGSFDVVAACEVIEHLENPREIVRQWHRVLDRAGSLVLTTPNNESWRAVLSLIFRGHFVAFQDSSYPAHISALLRKDISRILKEAGFGEPEFRYTGHGLVPRVTRLTWQQVSGGLLGGLRYSDNLVAFARRSDGGAAA